MIAKIDSFVAKIVNLSYIQTSGAITPLLKFITNLGKSGIIYIVIVAILLLFKKTRRQGIVLGFSILFATIVCYILKYSVTRPRPYTLFDTSYYTYWIETGKTTEKCFSFPSGHTTCASAFAFSLFFLTKSKWRYFYIFIPLIMAYTRIYFSVHYFTDCLMGFFLGLIFSYISVSLNNHFFKKV